MFDRHFLGDAALAILLSIPAAALAPPDLVTAIQADNAPAAHVQMGKVSAEDRPVSLLR